MKIQVQVLIGGVPVKEDVVEIDDYKLMPLTEEERESSVEIVVRNWIDRQIEVAWEVVEDVSETEEGED